MTSAFMFLNCDPKHVDSVMNELKKLPNASNIYETSGIYDIIVRIETSSEEVLNLVVRKIRTLLGITCTTTTIIARFKEGSKK